MLSASALHMITPEENQFCLHLHCTRPQACAQAIASLVVELLHKISSLGYHVCAAPWFMR